MIETQLNEYDMAIDYFFLLEIFADDVAQNDESANTQNTTQRSSKPISTLTQELSTTANPGVISKSIYFFSIIF